jgi:putative iron-regulated protein
MLDAPAELVKVMFNMTQRASLKALSLAASLCLALPLAACGDDAGGAGGGGGGGTGQGPSAEAMQEVVDAYAANALTAYGLALDGALTLQDAVVAFVAAPSDDTLADARAAWNLARPAYLQTEVFRFYGGPIDDEEDGPEGRINGWPLDEAYIDYVVDADGEPIEGGLVNLPEEMPSITQEAIAEANEVGGEKNLSAGFHAIEFLLWGQDLSETGPGDRPFTDYTTAPNAERRGLYLTEVTALLVADLESVEHGWKPGSGDHQHYVDTFVADDPTVSLTKIVTGMGSLSGAELTSERMNNAFQERDQEEEHSCFSDTTHVDHLNDLQGIENVYLGTWNGADGPGIDQLVAEVDPDLDARMKADLAAAKAAIEAIPQPFDQAIQDDAAGRPAIEAAMAALTTLTATTVEVADALGLTLNLE